MGAQLRNLQGGDDPDDDMSEMRLMGRIERLDNQSADRMLEGVVDADDAAPGYSSVVELVQRARSGVDISASDREQATVAAMRAVLVDRVVPVPADVRRRSMRSKIIVPKAALAAGAIVLGAGTAAAAVSGNFSPSHAPPKSDTTTAVGSSPTRDSSPSDQSQQGTPNTLSPTGSDSPTPSGSGGEAAPNADDTFGLCTAFLAGSPNAATGKDGSTAFLALIAAHGGTVSATQSFCQTFVSANHPGNPSGSPSSDVNSGTGSDENSSTGPDENSGSSSDDNSGTSSDDNSGTSSDEAGNPGTTSASDSSSQSETPLPDSGGSATGETGNGGSDDHSAGMAQGTSGGASASGSAESSDHGSD